MWCFVLMISRWLLHIQLEHMCFRQEKRVEDGEGQRTKSLQAKLSLHMRKEDAAGTSTNILKVGNELYQPHLAASVAGKWNMHYCLYYQEWRQLKMCCITQARVSQFRIHPSQPGLSFTCPPWPPYLYLCLQCLPYMLFSAESGHRFWSMFWP